MLKKQNSTLGVTGSSVTTAGAAVGAAAATAPDSSIEYVLTQADTPDKFCTALAKLFGVRLTEVALLKLEKGLLRFVLPEQLKTAGSIPVSSSSAVAAHTASTKKTELFNSFVKVKHASIFETVKLSTSDESGQPEQGTIQKLMSAPILDPHRKVLGVIQISRKGYDPGTCGPDFTLDDLQQLELAAKIACNLPFMK